jgi:hypothetical protein
MNKIRITMNELNRLVNWVNSLPEPPMSITIEESDSSGIGNEITAFTYDLHGNSGMWSKISDYKEW